MEQGNLWMYDVKTQERHALLKEPYQDITWGFNWSPDGQWICFKALTANQDHVAALVHREGQAKGFRVLLPNPDLPDVVNFNSHFAWEPTEGKRILASLVTRQNSNYQLHLIDPEGKAPTAAACGARSRRVVDQWGPGRPMANASSSACFRATAIWALGSDRCGSGVSGVAVWGRISQSASLDGRIGKSVLQRDRPSNQNPYSGEIAMRHFVALLIAIFALSGTAGGQVLTTADQPKPDGRTAETTILGGWRAESVSMTLDGGRRKSFSAAEGPISLIVTDKNFTLRAGAKVLVDMTYTADPKQDPCQVDLTSADGTMLGIYKLDGDRLRVGAERRCAGTADQHRPTVTRPRHGAGAHRRRAAVDHQCRRLRPAPVLLFAGLRRLWISGLVARRQQGCL